jgi:hypothetical protein
MMTDIVTIRTEIRCHGLLAAAYTLRFELAI